MVRIQYSNQFLLVIALVVCLVFIAHAADTPKRLFGNQPYTPTRLEWLAVELNAGLRVPLSEETRFSIDFVPLGKEDAILIFVRYLPTVNREVMNMSIDTARKVISINAKSYGWLSWLKVKEDVQMGKTGEAEPSAPPARDKAPVR